MQSILLHIDLPGRRFSTVTVHLPVTAVALLFILCAQVSFGQPPVRLWTTNLSGVVFAADAQTNVYVQVGTSVIAVSGDGVPLQTNSLSIYPGIAQRDSAGNFYFAGVYQGAPSGGFICYSPSFVLMKYDGAGSLLWSNNWGFSGCVKSILITDLRFDSNGNVYGAWVVSQGTTDIHCRVSKFSSDGTNLWNIEVNGGYPNSTGACRLGPLWNTNGVGLGYSALYQSVSMLDLVGSGATSLGSYYTHENISIVQSTVRPVGNFAQQFYDVEGNLIKRDAKGAVIWSVGTPFNWTFGEDAYGGVHVGGDGGDLGRYDYDGNLVWTTNFSSRCTAMVLDPFGNRFISFADGSVSRLSGETIFAPNIISNLQGQTVLAGSNYTIRVTASGSAPLTYSWYLNGSLISNKTSATLALTNLTMANAGTYTVVVSNFAGSVTSAPALLRVKSVALFLGNQLLTNGVYTFASAPSLSIRFSYPNGSAFYTLDGSTPYFGSTHYTAPFTVSQSATVRAVAYSADFSQSEEGDSVNIVILTTHTLTAISSGGGSVSFNPPGGTYISTNTVTVTAVPAGGWTFLQWLGDASGNSPSVQVSMERDKQVRAVFATTLSTTVAGNGQVQLYPPGGTYSYGTTVRVTGVADPGNYFGFWGNAATGNTNPLDFTVTAPTQTISSIFGPTPANWSALTILINGSGHVSRNPFANDYTNTQTVLLTAIPDNGQSFLGWSGDASGTQNPLSLAMSQSRVVTANFSGRPQLRPDGLSASGFRLTLLTPPTNTWQILGSTNESSWQVLGTVTNTQGEIDFLDAAATTLRTRVYRADRFLGPP